jgi:radical SAM superfamily enzyme YgiQ (UPF0313 family)
MNVLLCMLNSKYIHSSLAPWYLLAGIEAYGHESISAEVIEGTVNMTLQDAADKLIAKNPSVIGFCCYIWNIAYIKKLLLIIKNALPEVVIILGGPEVSFNAGEVLNSEPLADYIISGEGEMPLALLLDALKTGHSAADIPGVCYRANGEPVAALPYCPAEAPPNPYTKAYFETLSGRIAYLETSRGCPFSCAFCLSGRIGGVRFFDVERAKRDIVLLANSGTQTVKFVDRTFNVNKKRAQEIFSFIIDSYGQAIPKGICFHFELAGDLLDDETLALISKAPAGAMQFEIGLQSFNPKTLDSINRKTDIGLLKRNIRRLISFGSAHVHIDLIAGLPQEDIKSFAESFNTAYALQPHMLQLGFLKLLHGASMREQAELFPCRYSEEPPYEVIQTPWLSVNDFKKLHDAEDALERLYNSGRFRRTLRYVLGQTGLTPFELFVRTGSFAAKKGTECISLDHFTALILEYFASYSGIDKMALRDALVCDRLATNSTGRLPPALQVKDPGLKKAVQSLALNEATRPADGINRGCAILYSENVLVYADYTAKDPVSGEYELKKQAI